MLGLSVHSWGYSILGNLKKILAWGFALVMLAVSVWAVIHALNIMAADGHWTIAVDGSGLINIMKATNDVTSEERAAYCLDPYNVYQNEYPEYMERGNSVAEEVQAILKRSYPVLTAAQMGIVYLNDATLTDAEAYNATQIAIWKTVTNGEYEVSEILVGREFTLYETLLASDVVMTEGPWVTADMSAARRQSSSSVRESYGPITFGVNTGSANLDAAIRSGNQLTVSPAVADRAWKISTSTGNNGAEAAGVRIGTRYYLNYEKAAAAAMEFSLAGVLADAKILSSAVEMISVHGESANQKLGLAGTTAADVVVRTIDPSEGTVGLTLNKTWGCDYAADCEVQYAAPSYFDVYENTPDGYSLVDSIEANYADAAGPNTSTAVANDLALKPYTEYVVLERTLVDVDLEHGDTVPNLVAGGSTSGTPGKYTVVDGVLSEVGVGESFYAGVKFTTGMASATEVVNAYNNIVDLDVTLSKAEVRSEEFPYEQLPFGSNFYIYMSTDNGESWSLAVEPVYMNSFEVAGSYVLRMEYGAMYRVVEDTELSSFGEYACPDAASYRTRSGLSGYNYAGLDNLQWVMFDDYSDGYSVTDARGGYDESIYLDGSYGRFTGIEWTTGLSSNPELQLISYFESSCDPANTWIRTASIAKTTVGNHPNGWGQDYQFNWEVLQEGEVVSNGTMGVSPDDEVEFYDEDGIVYGPDPVFPNYTYRVYEDPMSFCANDAVVATETVTTAEGVVEKTTTTTTSAVTWRMSRGSGNVARTRREYAEVDCATGVMGSWVSSVPSSGTYVTRISVDIYDSLPNAAVTLEATNSFEETVQKVYSTPPAQGFGLILKYGHDSGGNTIATYLDGTKFDLYDAAGNLIVDDWELTADRRGLFGTVNGTADYYVTPALDAGEYYLMEVEAVPGYIADTTAQYHFTVEEMVETPIFEITEVRVNGAAPAGDSNLDLAIKNEPTYALEVFKFKRKILSDALADSRIELYLETGTGEEPAYGNEHLRGYELVKEITTDELGTVIHGLNYGWYRLVEVMPPAGYTGPTPDVAVGYPAYVGPSEDPNNRHSGTRLYIANDWIGIVPDDPDDDPVVNVPATGVVDESGLDGGMVSAVCWGMGGAAVLMLTALMVFARKRSRCYTKWH